MIANHDAQLTAPYDRSSHFGGDEMEVAYDCEACESESDVLGEVIWADKSPDEFEAEVSVKCPQCGEAGTAYHTESRWDNHPDV